MIRIKNLSVSIEGKKILKNISFDFKPGKTYALLGPNGSGKSTLASAIMGHPYMAYSKDAKILMAKKNIKSLSPDARARVGMFLSFQTPLMLPGVTLFEFMRLALEKQIDAVTLHAQIKTLAQELGIQNELLKRSLNDGFSGGEKKKLEALQAVLLQPTFAMFDEIDTGVDVDAVQTIAKFLKKHLPKQTTAVFITHSARLLRFIQPHTVIVMKEGKLVKTGGPALSRKIESEGFNKM